MSNAALIGGQNDHNGKPSILFAQGSLSVRLLHYRVLVCEFVFQLGNTFIQENDGLMKNLRLQTFSVVEGIKWFAWLVTLCSAPYFQRKARTQEGPCHFRIFSNRQRIAKSRAKFTKHSLEYTSRAKTY